MVISDAKRLVGKTCSITWLDRAGCEVHIVSKIHDATFVPLYGGYLITDTEDIRLDKVTEVHIFAEGENTASSTQAAPEDLRAAA